MTSAAPGLPRVFSPARQDQEAPPERTDDSGEQPGVTVTVHQQIRMASLVPAEFRSARNRGGGGHAARPRSGAAADTSGRWRPGPSPPATTGPQARKSSDLPASFFGPQQQETAARWRAAVPQRRRPARPAGFARTRVRPQVQPGPAGAPHFASSSRVSPRQIRRVSKLKAVGQGHEQETALVRRTDVDFTTRKCQLGTPPWNGSRLPEVKPDPAAGFRYRAPRT